MKRIAITFLAVVVLVSLYFLSNAAEPEGEKSDPRNRSTPTSQGDIPMAIQLTSKAFEDGQPIPKKYTGEGYDISPPLAWTGLPERTKELVLICDDPDAPTDEPWVHWVIYKIPASCPGFKEGVPQKTRLTDPPGTLQGKNSWPNGQNNVGYRGPMPPPRHGTHRYYFKIYALEAKLAVEANMDKNAILKEIEGHILAQGQLMGTYSR